MSAGDRTSRRTGAARRSMAWVRLRAGQGGALASTTWRRLQTKLKRTVMWTVAVPLPQIIYVLWFNKTQVTRQPSVPAERVRRANDIDKDASIALWQADTDRLNGLAAKAGAVLAADALVAAGLVTQTESRGWAFWACIVCVAYLVSGSAAACLVQMPMKRQFVLPKHILDGEAERRMIQVVVGNEVLGTRTQNLVNVAVRDTFISLAALLVVFVFNLWG